MCDCSNEKIGLSCICDWVEKNPGETSFCCDFCGIYEAGKARCNKCETFSSDCSEYFDTEDTYQEILEDYYGQEQDEVSESLFYFLNEEEF